MRGEGRLHGHETSGEHQRVKVSPNSRKSSKFSSKCRKVRCRGCRDHPVHKSLPKIKGASKAYAMDVASNYALHDWSLHRHFLKISSLHPHFHHHHSYDFDFCDDTHDSAFFQPLHHQTLVDDHLLVPFHDFFHFPSSSDNDACHDDGGDSCSIGIDWCLVGDDSDDDDDDWCFC